MRAALFALIFLRCGKVSGGSAASCLSEAIPESERKYMQDDEGGELSVGLLQGTWVSSALTTAMTKIWIGEVLGYHCHIHPEKATSGASPIWALAGCITFDDSRDKRCGPNETRIHVSVDSWVGSYASDQEKFKKEHPDVAAVDLGGMGYSGEETIYVSRAIGEKALTEKGLALTYYRSYNTSHHDPKKYFDSLSDVDWSELARCNESDFSNAERMNAYALYSGDYDGVVQQPDGSYFAKCMDDRWWLAPACRDDSTKCIPTFTASPGWKLQAMMQWTAAYDFPAAIGISSPWANFEKHVRTVRALHYWWVPDSTFIEMLPQPIIFPRHSASEWAIGNKKTGGVGSYISKMVSSNLHSKAALVQDFVAQINFELPEVQDLLLHHKQSGLSWEEVACDWIKGNRDRWTEWIPDETACSPQFGLFNEKTQEFVWDRADRANLACRACPSGHFSEELEDESGKTYICQRCPVGTSQASGASLQCNPCSRGEYQDEEAMSSCKRCNQGEYQGEEGQGLCLKCPEGTTTLGYGSNDLSDCGCEEGTINLGTGTNFHCVPCGAGLLCPFSSSTENLKAGASTRKDLAFPKLKAGFYSSQQDPLSVLRCEPASYCLGGRPGECAGGLLGEPCAICPDGQNWVQDQCVDCGIMPAAWPIGILVGMIALSTGYYVFNVKVNAQASPTKVGSIACGVAINVMQTIALMGMMTVAWPKEMEATSTGMSFMLLDVQSIGMECVVGSGAVGRYVVSVMLFPAALSWLLICSWLTRIFPKFPGLRRFQPWTWTGTINVMGMLLQVGFSTICSVVLQPMMCYLHPNGTRSLLKYPNVMCGDSEQSTMMAAGLMVGSICIVAFYAGCVYAAVRIPAWSMKSNPRAVKAFQFLTSNFRLDRWWFGLLLLARGFCFSLVIVVATDTVAAQTSLATLTLVLYGFAQAIMWPWKAPIINASDTLLSVLLILLATRSKSTAVEVDDDWNFSRVFTLMLLVAVTIAIAFLVLASVCAVCTFYLSPAETGKRRSSVILNLSKAMTADTAFEALQQINRAFASTDPQELRDTIEVMNHYDVKVVLKAIGILDNILLSRALPASTRLRMETRVTSSQIFSKVDQDEKDGVGKANTGVPSPEANTGVPSPEASEPDECSPNVSASSFEADEDGVGKANTGLPSPASEPDELSAPSSFEAVQLSLAITAGSSPTPYDSNELEQVGIGLPEPGKIVQTEL